MTERSRRFLLRLGVSASLLAVLGVIVEPREVLARLSDLRAPWIAAAGSVTVVQIVISAWRWRFTAGRLGIVLPMRTAVSEYYLATFLNQVLPGGVFGDVSRAWRHARSGEVVEAGEPARPLRSVHAVILERTSGQAVMAGVALLSALVLLSPRTTATRAVLVPSLVEGAPAGVLLGVGGVVAVLGACLLWLLVRRATRLPALHRFLMDARESLLGAALPAQTVASLSIVASYVVVFVMAARAVGVTTPVGVLAPLVPPILVTMLIPVSIAGWGVREGAAAVLWGAVGLTAADGVAISVTYGLLILVSSLPGAGVLLMALRFDRARGRRGDRSPAGSAEREV